MALTKEQSNKIKVTEITEVGYINGEKIYAENLQKWAYRRLETWPELLDACKYTIEQLKSVKGKAFPIMPILQAIAKAEK